MNDRIIKDVCIKCNKCGRDIKFKVHYDCNNDNKYIKSRLDDACVCSCNGAIPSNSWIYTGSSGIYIWILTPRSDNLGNGTRALFISYSGYLAEKTNNSDGLIFHLKFVQHYTYHYK